MTDPKKPVVTEPKSVDNNSVPVKKSKDTGQEDKIAEYKPYYGMLHSHTGHLYLQGECPKDCNPEGNNECSRPPREVFYVEKDKTTKKVIFAGFKAIPHAQGCPMNAFKVASRAGLDFIALTEHSNSFTDETWERQGEMTQKYSSNNPEFLALRGMELTFPGTSIGHLNTFNTTDYATRYSVSQKYDLASWVKQEITCIVQDPEKAEAIYTMLNNDIAEVKSHLNDTKKIEDSMLQNKAMKTKYNSFKTAMGSGGKIEEFYSNELYGRIEAYLMEAYNYFFKKKANCRMLIIIYLQEWFCV
jgi:hypothetical protein